ncbi:Amuc_1434 family mucin 2-degrading aspartic protease [Akkermansia sp.]|uniref:Amuc_1434 family mucin 2-degrading aspartic protease n=1 Tax=Akkermansia sp. TaxID=1872421 RepID=UPI0025C05DCE|nr:Amuc_1434 family mucin 2-degrading aspartic protease [Akkermansia sp.]
MFLRLLSSFSLMAGMTLVAQANAQPYPDSDSSDGYDTGYYAEAYSGGYNSSPAPTGENASKPVFPTQSYFELLGPMDSRNGHGSVNIQNWMTDLNLCRMSSGSWGFSSTAALRLSWFNGEGAREMDVDELYTIWLNVTASYKLRGKTRLVFGVTPQISTDFDTWTTHNLFFGGHALLAGPLNDRFSYGIGVGCYPQLGDFPLLPLIQFEWKATNNWTLQLEGARLSYTSKVSEGLTWGPFVAVVSGTWTIHHDRRVRQFEWISGVAGVGADVGLGHWGSVRPRLVADVGFSFGNSGTIKTSNGSHELEKYHYDPGFYLRAGLQFEF